MTPALDGDAHSPEWWAGWLFKAVGGEGKADDSALYRYAVAMVAEVMRTTAIALRNPIMGHFDALSDTPAALPEIKRR